MSAGTIASRDDGPLLAGSGRGLSPAIHPAPTRAITTILANGSVVDLDHGIVVPADVVLRNGTIEAVGEAGSAPYETGALVLDLGGAWLVPGLVDAHAHLSGGAEPRPSSHQVTGRLSSYMAAGVTTIRDAGARDGSIATLATATTVPRIVAARRPIRQSGQRARAVAAAQSEVAAGAAWLKAYALSPSELDGVLTIGRERGLPVGAHLGDDPAACLALGLEAVEHVYTLIRHDLVPFELRSASWIPVADRAVSTWFVTDPESSWVTDWYETVGARRPFVTSTLLVMSALRGRRASIGSGFGDVVAPWAPEDQRSGWQARLESWGWWDLEPGSSPELRDLAFENICRTASALVTAGARVCAGTDFGEPLIEPGTGLISEMKLLELAGLSRLDVLRSATRVPADLLGLGGEIGSLSVGMRADILAVSEDPLSSLDALDNPVLVVAGGDVVVDRRSAARNAGGHDS